MRRPTTILAAALILLTAVAALFIAIILRADGDERDQIDKRIQERARVSAALTTSIFGSSTVSSAQAASKQLGGAKPTSAQVDAVVKGQGTQYAAVLDARGQVLAGTAGVTAAVRTRLQERTPAVKRVLDGAPYAYSSRLQTATGPVYEGYTTFATPAGKRVIMRAYPVKAFTAFFAGFLKDLPGNQAGRIYVVDAQESVIASPSKSQPVGTLRDSALAKALRGGRFGEYSGGQRVFAASPVQGTGYRVVLTARRSTLYAGVGDAAPWVLLGLMVLAGLVAVALTWRNAVGRVRLRETADELAHANGEMRETAAALERSNLDLETTNDELKRSNAELEQFASVASHDLQEPLRKVQTFGDQLERRFGDDIPDEGKDYLRRMRSASARMSSLIEDLLRFSRVTTHARPARTVDLGRIAREVTIDLDQQRAEAHGTVDIGDLPTLDADPLQMRQLLQNLIGNALKFHRPGEPPVVTVHSVPAADGEVAFEVADNGIGFDPIYGERIFRVFERLHAREVYDGTGIGLALSRKIVERHGGTIVATSAPDVGARFLVTMPRVRSAASPVRPVERPEADAGPREPAGVS